MKMKLIASLLLVGCSMHIYGANGAVGRFAAAAMTEQEREARAKSAQAEAARLEREKANEQTRHEQERERMRKIQAIQDAQGYNR